MNHNDLLVDAFGRIRDLVHRATGGARPEDLTYRPDPDANSIAWLVWHLTRVIDDHVSDLAGTEQRWTADGWFDRFGLPFDPAETGYGHSSEEVGQVQTTSDLLTAYHDAVHTATVDYLKRVTPEDLDEIVDRNWDPPVTAGVRLVSVVGDSLQHLGQAGYVLGMSQRR